MVLILIELFTFVSVLFYTILHPSFSFSSTSIFLVLEMNVPYIICMYILGTSVDLEISSEFFYIYCYSSL